MYEAKYRSIYECLTNIRRQWWLAFCGNDSRIRSQEILDGFLMCFDVCFLAAVQLEHNVKSRSAAIGQQLRYDTDRKRSALIGQRSQRPPIDERDLRSRTDSRAILGVLR
jgi:hypothetical protein